MYWKEAAAQSDYKVAFRRKADGAITFIHAGGFACRTNGELGLVPIKKAARIDEFKDYQPIEAHANWEGCVKQLKILMDKEGVVITIPEAPKSEGLLAKVREAEGLCKEICDLTATLDGCGLSGETAGVLEKLIETATKFRGML